MDLNFYKVFIMYSGIIETVIASSSIDALKKVLMKNFSDTKFECFTIEFEDIWNSDGNVWMEYEVKLGGVGFFVRIEIFKPTIK